LVKNIISIIFDFLNQNLFTMKKIFSIFVLFFAFTFVANAQENFSDEVREKTKKQAYEIAAYFNITEVTQIKDIQSMLLHKHKVETTDFDAQRKSNISTSLKDKFKSMLNKEQLLKLQNNEQILNKYF
jgi:hypothetical protein